MVAENNDMSFFQLFQYCLRSGSGTIGVHFNRYMRWWFKKFSHIQADPMKHLNMLDISTGLDRALSCMVLISTLFCQSWAVIISLSILIHLFLYIIFLKTVILNDSIKAMIPFNLGRWKIKICTYIVKVWVIQPLNHYFTIFIDSKVPLGL